jgi:UDP-N-acetylmuramate--alanine ligase
VIEADEWQASFLNYHPDIIVLTNIEREHLDYYKDLNHILRTYQKYLSLLEKGGIVIFNGKDKNIQKILKRGKTIKSLDFSKLRTKNLLKNSLKIPGSHNISNALSALAVAKTLKIPSEISLQALSQYQGSWRRFQEKQVSLGEKKIKAISDYGHHPTEIKATLSAVREKYPKKEIILLFQPHQYQRTYYLFKDFLKTFRDCRKAGNLDKLVVTDIYDVAGRERKGIKKKIK